MELCALLHTIGRPQIEKGKKYIVWFWYVFEMRERGNPST